METQPDTILVEFIHYNNWANAQLLAACQKLTADQLAAAAPGAYGTIRDTLVHIIRAEADYIGRLTGNRPQPSFKWEDPPAPATLSAFADQVAGALLDTIHGVEHRTNITTILSSLGLPTPEVDGWGYLISHPDQFEMKKNW